MARTPRDITDAELAVMQALWQTGAATIRQLMEILYGEGGGSQYATVQKLLERLEKKGCVRRDRGHAVHVFSAAIHRGELIGRRLRDVADKLCGGSLTPLLSHLVHARPLTQRERDELRALIDELGKKRKPKSDDP